MIWHFLFQHVKDLRTGNVVLTTEQCYDIEKK